MKKQRKIIFHSIALVLLIVASVVIIRQNSAMPYQVNQGMVFGTFYKITYQHDKNLQKEIEAQLKSVNDALSMFDKKSIITAVNNNEPVKLNDMFVNVFKLAQSISEDTDGAFDITVAPLVNAWGFGYKSGALPSQQDIDSIRAFVGYQKVKLSGMRIQKEDARLTLDCSAIAKGYGTDVVARYLLREGIKNFMVEIGGEIVTHGVNPKRQQWSIGIEKPVEDSLAMKSELQTVLKVDDIAMATSGNYRNFYYKDGKKYAHTIDPKTGFPVQHNILSATVLAKQCAVADAYATAFMVMGLEKSKEVLARHKDLKAYLIYDDNGKYGIWKSPGL
ncbi:MAG: FAD:protein FMN transferase [Prevotella sp.]|nr:FAD:protein FMN transferase [Prevotella sp.]